MQMATSSLRSHHLHQYPHVYTDYEQPHPPEEFSCQNKIWNAVLNQPLDRPPGEKFVYSDISMITLMYVVGTVVAQQHLVQPSDLLPACVGSGSAGVGVGGTHHGIDPSAVPGPLAQCYYEAFVRLHVFGTLGMTNTGFLPPASEKSRCAPAWNDTRQDAPGGVPYVLPTSLWVWLLERLL